MLRTNSKKAKENLKRYISDCWNIEEGEELRTWEETKEDIKNSFIKEVYNTEWQRRQNRAAAFGDWLSGLPKAIGDFYLSQAVQDLGDILEESEEERAKFTEDQAIKKLNYLIYNAVFY